jgi:hypothetical protein
MKGLKCRSSSNDRDESLNETPVDGMTLKLKALETEEAGLLLRSTGEGELDLPDDEVRS